MATVIGVRFKNAGKLYFFHPGALWPSAGDYVIVETARGVEFGEVVTGVREIDDDQIIAPLKQVIRIASADDIQHAQENEKNEREAYAVCQRKIAEHKLDMKLVSVEYTFDNSKILFYFTANGRVDFRSLVKDLASVFKTRIELRQIGVRDEAKMLGGLGPCGRPICCGSFLGDFQPVSIKMAKEQNLSLNPTKISGVCGRLMCCLKYEQDNYELTRKRMPKVGKEVIVPDGRGVVWDVNVIKETVRVRIQKGDSSELKDYPMEDVQRVAQQGAPEASQASFREENESAQETEVRPPRRERPAKPSVDVVDEKSPASVSPWLAAVDHAMRAASSQDDDLPEELLDGAGEDEDFTLAEEAAEENPDDLLSFPDLMEEAPETGNEEDKQP
jgi:cell fate regulator YaaT (PSP1 superfamily)